MTYSNIYNAQQNYCVFIIFDNFLGLIAISNILKQSDAFLQSFTEKEACHKLIKYAVITTDTLM